jgi:predicted membrane-bound spermidine synthase
VITLSLIVFFLSGFAALLYQITWQRLLAIFSGADVYSATMVVAAFMAGLGCGSLAGGHLADRLSRTGGLLAFAVAEAAIALFGFQSKTIFYDVLYGRFAAVADNPVLTGTILFFTLLWPTALMGASLPLLSRALTARAAVAARTIGWLYALNTLGAASGALIGVWGFFPRYGLEGTLQWAAWINFTCAALAIPLVLTSAFLAGKPATEATAPPDPSARVTTQLPYAFWVGAFALSGFIGLSLELIWFRMLGVMLKSTAFTFGTLLAQYLFWLGLGSLVGGVFASRIRTPAPFFLVLQTTAGLFAGAGVAYLIARLDTAPSLQWLYEYFARYEPLDIVEATGEIRGFVNDVIWNPTWRRLPGGFFQLYFGLPALLIAPATLLMGMSFPILQRAVQSDTGRLGRRLGTLLLANILGSTLGTMLTGWVLLSVAGTATTLRIMTLLSGLFAFAAWRLLPNHRVLARIVAPVLCACAVTTAIVMPSGTRLWAALHGTASQRLIVAEDGSGVSVLRGREPSFDRNVTVFLNGLGQSELPYGGIHTVLGALPALLHPMPRSAAVIGLGSGDTLFAVAGRGDLDRILSIEIVKPQMITLAALFERQPYPGLRAVLRDPRIEHVFGDGRLLLSTTSERFDIIEADALRPNSAYAGNLYSYEYFRLMRDRLTPGGFAVTWVPTDRVARTFLRAFEHAVSFGSVLIGSNAPIQVDRALVERRLADPAVRRHYSEAGVDIERLLVDMLATARLFGPDPARLVVADVNTDADPRDEFEIPEIFDPSLFRPEGSR